MALLDPSLHAQAAGRPGAQFPVLITLKDDAALPDALQGKGHFVLQDKVYAATIPGKLVQALAGDASVEAVEPDGEVHIL